MKTLWCATALLLTSTVAATGCDEAAAPTCGVPGGTQSCVCSSGSTGAQTCEASGAWGTCLCAGSPDAGDAVSTLRDTVQDMAAEVGGETGSDVVADTAEVDVAPTCTPACADYEDCVEGACKNRFDGVYTPGEFSIVTDRGTCTAKFGMIVDTMSGIRLFGADPTTGEPDFAFSKVECSTGFQGSSLPLKIVVKEKDPSALAMVSPNRIEGELHLEMSHADFSATVTVTLNTTVGGGKISGTLDGLPQSVDLGLPTNVTAGTFATPNG